jgi:hypothetical protein
VSGGVLTHGCENWAGNPSQDSSATQVQYFEIILIVLGGQRGVDFYKG